MLGLVDTQRGTLKADFGHLSLQLGNHTRLFHTFPLLRSASSCLVFLTHANVEASRETDLEDSKGTSL